MPVFPTAHYAMGGIPTDVETRVLRDNEHVIPGLYAAGECACVSVHGSNRLGTNSLLDINVFGRRAGIAAADYANQADFVELPEDAQGQTITLVEELRSSTGGERVAVLRREMQETMDMNAQVYRNEATLKQALSDVQELRRRYRNIAIQDRSLIHISSAVPGSQPSRSVGPYTGAKGRPDSVTASISSSGRVRASTRASGATL